MVVTAAVRVLILTEDAAGDAHRVVETLLRRIFRDALCPVTQTQRIEFLPGADDTPAGKARAKVLTANLWKSTRPGDHRQLVDLCGYLADQLSESRFPVFVIHHFDGDTPWSERASARTPTQWVETLRHRVEQRLKEPGRIRGLVALTPHYSIEAWLYQNQERLDRIAADLGVEPIPEPEEGWEEVAKPKERHGWLRDRHNAALAEAFPTARVYEVGRSFHAAVEALRAVPGLVDALDATAR